MSKLISVILHESNAFIRYGLAEYIKEYYPQLRIICTPVQTEDLYTAVMTVDFDIVITDILNKHRLLLIDDSFVDLFSRTFPERLMIFMGVKSPLPLNLPRNLLRDAIQIDRKTSLLSLKSIFRKVSQREFIGSDNWLNNRQQKPLSRREMTIIRRLIQGHSAHEISTECRISAVTVSIHKRNALKKLGIKNLRSFYLQHS